MQNIFFPDLEEKEVEVVPTVDQIPPLVEDNSDDEEEEGRGGRASDEWGPEDDAPA